MELTREKEEKQIKLERRISKLEKEISVTNKWLEVTQRKMTFEELVRYADAKAKIEKLKSQLQ